MMQGDKYSIEIEILDKDGNRVTNNSVRDVEITIGRMTKSFAKGEVEYANGLWLFPFGQEESFGLYPARTSAQVRVKWLGGEIEGATMDNIVVKESASKNIL